MNAQQSIVVVAPTYNEKETIRDFAREIFSLNIPELSLVIVDDNSPDGTGKIAEQLGQSYPLRVIHRASKLGLGTAYVAAFREILSERPDLIIQMDADLSHDFKTIPQFLKTAESCDLVLASRYIAGGEIANWGILRRIVSRLGNFYARNLLGLPYRDLTGGFKCFRRQTLQALDLNALSSIGYNFQIETTYLSHLAGFKICEIPTTFTERRAGSSKMGLGIIIESFWKVLLLRLRKRQRT